jgi:hypothetical protein
VNLIAAGKGVSYCDWQQIALSEAVGNQRGPLPRCGVGREAVSFAVYRCEHEDSEYCAEVKSERELNLSIRCPNQ